VALDKVAVTFGTEILKLIPGRVSTEIDARLSYNTEATIGKCRALYAMYEGMPGWDGTGTGWEGAWWRDS
jgi:transaldolase